MHLISDSSIARSYMYVYICGDELDSGEVSGHVSKD